MARSRTNFDFAIAEQMAWFLAPGVASINCRHTQAAVGLGGAN